MAKEVWRSVVGYEGKYEVSNHGRVRSLARRVRVLAPNGAEATRAVTPRVLRPAPLTSGHLMVMLGRKNNKNVHVLVALAFIGPRPAGYDVAHVDGNPTNNHASNLRYKTRSENNKDVVAHGRRRLTVSQVHFIRRTATALPHGGKAGLARQLGVSPGLLSAVLSGRLYAHV